MGDAPSPSGPDFTQGVALADVPVGGSLLGRAGDEAVLLVRPTEDEVFAVGASCTHYGGPLAEGCVVGHEVRCPWHHARFDVRTGEAVAAPALSPVACWRVERRGAQVVLADKLVRAPKKAPSNAPASVSIVGAGAAGNAAAERLRDEGYAGPIAMFGAEASRPPDRPNLSKDFLAGTAPEEWVTLRDDAFYKDRDIELATGTRVAKIDTAARAIELADGTRRTYGALLLATGAEPVTLPLAGDIHYLRSLDDSRRIIARAGCAKQAVVIGASFIGLEVAASLRARGVAVHVVAPDERPLQRVLGPELGDFVRALHEEHGVAFHLRRHVAAIDGGKATLDDGTQLPADLVVAGVGVRPATALAEQAGLRLDRGVAVDAYLATSAPGVWAAGDIARWPDARTGAAIRVEHWVVAERQGQTAARNMLGQRTPFATVPFFWSQHYDVPIAYIGHAEAWDRIDVLGSIRDRDCAVVYRRGGKVAAVATIGRDRMSLELEAAMEAGDDDALEMRLRL